MKWIKLSEQKPLVNVDVLISDGSTVAIACLNVYTVGNTDRTFDSWSSNSFSGYEWDWDFTPTYWAEIDFELPNKGEEYGYDRSMSGRV